MPKQMQKPAAAGAAALAPGQAPSVTVVVKSLHRSPPLDVKLTRPEYDFALATTSLLDVRTALADKTHVPLEKLRLLHNKKPVPDSKALKDVAAAASAGGQPTEIELGVMVTGGAATVAAAAATAAAAAAAQPAAEHAGPETVAAESEAFWTDLRGFLVKRTGSEKQADELFSLFLRSWEDRMV